MERIFLLVLLTLGISTALPATHRSFSPSVSSSADSSSSSFGHSPSSSPSSSSTSFFSSSSSSSSASSSLPTSAPACQGGPVEPASSLVCSVDCSMKRLRRTYERKREGVGFLFVNPQLESQLNSTQQCREPFLRQLSLYHSLLHNLTTFYRQRNRRDYANKLEVGTNAIDLLQQGLKADIDPESDLTHVPHVEFSNVDDAHIWGFRLAGFLRQVLPDESCSCGRRRRGGRRRRRGRGRGKNGRKQTTVEKKFSQLPQEDKIKPVASSPDNDDAPGNISGNSMVTSATDSNLSPSAMVASLGSKKAGSAATGNSKRGKGRRRRRQGRRNRRRCRRNGKGRGNKGRGRCAGKAGRKGRNRVAERKASKE